MNFTAIGKSIVNTGTVCGAAAAGIGWWFYNLLISSPLRCFYFKGIWWGNIPISEICFRMTKSPASFWNGSDVARAECKALTEQQFEMWDSTVMVVLYMTALTWLVLYGTCYCCVVKPAVYYIERHYNHN